MNVRSLGILVGAALFLTASSTPADLIVGGSVPSGDQTGAGFVPLFTVLLGGNEATKAMRTSGTRTVADPPR